MSIKPSVVFIKGVHSTTGHDTDSDIGFPQLELEKLFEGATIKEYTGNYDPNKKFIYKENSYSKNIESSAQFTCLKDGYSIPPASVQEYFYKNGNNYVKHIVPDLSTWENRLSESNFIKNKIIYIINNPNSWTYVKISDDYYDRTSSGYDKKTVNTYHCYNIIEVDLEHEYKASFDLEIGDTIWSVTNGGTLQNGFFIYKDGNSIISLGNIKFGENSQILEGNTQGCTADIYRINYDQSFYIIESGKMMLVTGDFNHKNTGENRQKLTNENDQKFTSHIFNYSIS